MIRARQSGLSEFFATPSLQKSFTLVGLTIAALLMIVFGLDLMFGWPLRQASVTFDAVFLFCGAALAWLSWDVMRDQIRGWL